MIVAAMIKGPNGMGCLRLIILKNNKHIPITAPNRHDKKKVNNTLLRPNTIPSRPNNFISPAPMPPLLTKIMIASSKNAIPPPISADHHGSSG